jgi:bifunctional polynucleotide phosphatase/kinase
MNIVRARLGISPRVSSIAYAVFNKNYEAATTAEGFAEVTDVPVVVDFDGLPPNARDYFFQLS